jgi:hypothetical protein
MSLNLIANFSGYILNQLQEVDLVYIFIFHGALAPTRLAGPTEPDRKFRIFESGFGID